MAETPRVYTSEQIRRHLQQDREITAAASDGWRHTHSTIVRDRDRVVVANMWTPRAPRSPADLVNKRPGAPQTYCGWETDPTHELADARFIVHARRALPLRGQMLEQVLQRVEELEALPQPLASSSAPPHPISPTDEHPEGVTARKIIEDCWGALNFILAFYGPGQPYLDTNAWKQAEASGRRAHAAAREWLDAVSPVGKP